MKTYRIIYSILLLFLGGHLIACNKTVKEEKMSSNSETAEIIAVDAQFNHDILNLIKSNENDKAVKMLENGVFLGLELIWESNGINFIKTNSMCNDAFEPIYPSIRQSVNTDRFTNTLPKARSNIMSFVKEADSVYLQRTNHC